MSATQGPVINLEDTRDLSYYTPITRSRSQTVQTIVVVAAHDSVIGLIFVLYP